MPGLSTQYLVLVKSPSCVLSWPSSSNEQGIDCVGFGGGWKQDVGTLGRINGLFYIFTFSHSLLVQATCPLYRYVLGYTFARRPLYLSGALWCNVSGNMFSSLQHDLFSGYIRAFLIANVAFSLFCQRRSMKIHRLPTSLIISSHRTHHTHNWYGFKWYVATKSHGQIFLSTFNMQTSGRIIFMQKHFWK